MKILRRSGISAVAGAPLLFPAMQEPPHFAPPGLAALRHSGISAIAGAPLLFPYRSPRGPLHGETCLENGDSMSII